ncbi:hypothetical protein ACFYST_00845 [Kitasatospora sp. NPDC004614]|uniref:hypothetical protein n=1 Tax=unclassified Kitasatospora TaxID=2633591 RepID=UPI0036AC77F8
MRTWTVRPALLRCVLLGLLALLALVAVTGCRAPGGLDDAGATRPIQAHPSPLPLWPVSATSAPPAAQASAVPQAPVPLPGLSAGSLTELDARAVLGAEPDLSSAERAALNGRCTGCEIRPAQYRDLNGDGSPELLTAVVAGADSEGGRAVLHVYTLRGREVLPVLTVAALPGFTAETVGEDLVVHEPTGPSAETSSTYRWNAGRMAFVDRRIKATGTDPNVPGCPADSAPTVPVVPTAGPLPRRDPTDSASPVPQGGRIPAARQGGAVQPVPTRNP